MVNSIPGVAWLPFRCKVIVFFFASDVPTGFWGKFGESGESLGKFVVLGVGGEGERKGVRKEPGKGERRSKGRRIKKPKRSLSTTVV